MNGPVELCVVGGNPTHEELCAVLVALRLATAPNAPAALQSQAVPAAGPWPVPRAVPQVSAVSWAAAPRTPAG
ncbi:hypothetical protein [Streptomyces sp. SYSU K217416]